MKKLGRLSAAAFSFASIANSSFAVSTDESASSGIGDIIPFALGALLIVCVLFIGYKMDKSSENAPTMKPKKAPKRKKAKVADEYTEAEETKVYAEENKSDVPYEADENEYYENDNSFDYKSGLNEDTEYEEDDISLFDSENEQESSFDDIDDNISYDIEDEEAHVEPTTQSAPAQNFDSTMIFDTNELNNIEDYEEPVQEPAQEVVEETVDNSEEIEYTDAVELDDKIDSLDDLDNMEMPELAKVEEQDAESFMNELNKYKEEVEDEDFGGFTTKSTSKEKKAEEDDNEAIEPLEEKHVKRYTKKKTTETTSKSLEELPQVPEENDFVEEPSDDQFVEAQSGQMDIGFLNQMEQNLKKHQEERMKKAGIEMNAPAEEPKKRGRKPKKQ